MKIFNSTAQVTLRLFLTFDLSQYVLISIVGARLNTQPSIGPQFAIRARGTLERRPPKLYMGNNVSRPCLFLQILSLET